jgi:hypothetical protein
MIMWSSVGRLIDGLWVGSHFSDDREAALKRVEAALHLVGVYDRPRYNRLRRDLDRIWVRLLTDGCAQFSPTWRACLIDERFVLADTTKTDMIAAAIVHEATHARLWHRGIGYEEDQRQRVEAICLRRELAFSRRLPDGSRVREWAEAGLAISPVHWTDTAFRDRGLDGRIRVLQHLERYWLVRVALAVLRWRLRRAERRTAGEG